MLEIKNLTKKFDNKVVLNGINLNVNKGDVIGIIGPSGCGKSTLLRCINLIEIPTSGEIVLDGDNLVDNKKHNITRRKIGMVFQQFNLFNHLNVLENIILSPVALKLMSKDEAIRRATELLKKIDLEDIMYSYPNRLSGGQKQRVAIIRTLIMNPEIILFDEPTSALDPEMIGEVTNLMRKLRDNGMTMLVVSHEMNFVKSFCNRVIFLSDGIIKEDRSSKELFENPKDDKLKTFLSKIGNY